MCLFLLEVFFQCTQTGQSSNNSPWFFDLNPLLFSCSISNEYFYNGVAQFSTRLLSIYFVIVKEFSIELKQDNQATIHHGSSTWIPCFGLETNSLTVFYDVLVQFAHAYWVFFIFIRLNVFVPNELKQVNRPTIFPCFFNLNPPL